MKYLPWGLAGLLAIALIWAMMASPGGEQIGTVNLGRIVEESVRAQQLNQMLSDRYNELVTRFDLESELEPEEDDVDRANRERTAYAEYLSYRLELETQFQREVDGIINEVAKGESVTLVLDEDVVRFGGMDLTDKVIKRLD
ncbi:MAG TPA: OmpH family outer membrane protein [Limnochordia bacterium]|nr:OmpH family outer membrane protein [Limnochordia bacterium]